jgi:NAD+ synthase (glutamine-hydrolysing)
VLIAAGPRFSFGDGGLTTAVVDIDLNRMNRARSGSFRPNLDPSRSDMVSVPFTIPAGDALPDTEARTSPTYSKEEEFTRAVSLGLFDYLRKSQSEGFVVSLSGGADSTAVSLLATVMVRLALRELGPDGMQAKLSYLRGAPADPTPEAWSRRLLTCMYQRTANSSDATRNAARTVAEALPAAWLDCDVEPAVRQYREMVEMALGRRLTWEDDDLALQNIQARARAPGIWMVANLRNALLLATSNRSEAAVGYTTMDGDTCGGLSPIAGIDKAFLRQWLRWMETTGPAGLGPWPAIGAVNALEPTAELRPLERHQTDEKDLMPYPALDAIERAAIRDKQSPIQVFHQMVHRFPETPRDQVRAWVERFFLLWSRNQWKRERYAPSFHLDDENLDPKTWCRFPILSGGFERELEALRDVE